MNSFQRNNLEIFNPLDQFLYAKHFLLKESSPLRFSEALSLTHYIDQIKMQHKNYLQSCTQYYRILELFTYPAFEYFFKVAHILVRKGYQGDELLTLSKLLVKNITNSEFLKPLLKVMVDSQKELEMLQKLQFQVNFEYFEDYLDSALKKVAEYYSCELKELTRHADFFKLLIEVSGASEVFPAIALAVFCALESAIMMRCMQREECYNISSRKGLLMEIRKTVSFGRADVIFPLDGKGFDLQQAELAYRQLVE